MSSSQITIWFTNARVKMRKENKLLLKKKKKEQRNNCNELIPFHDEISPAKRFIIAYSCLNLQQTVCY